ncbi:YkuS family protein [Acidaminobacter sp. JC074]|uniref:YkuS family protein n=1 Tax=Acidaminobacter sp. JC074 TaxID=2530199 RepID=UPI001F103111|nr:YkuS family protein [Acidaminobacter sp. JC074]
MKNYKIAVQRGLDEVEAALKQEGFDVYKYGTAGLDADVTIVTGIDEAYEEIQPAQYHANGKKKMLVIDGTNSTTEEIMQRVHRHVKG